MSSGRPRILHVTAPGMVGGLESVVSLLVTGLADRGHAVGLVAALEPGVREPPFLETAREHGVAVHVVRAGSRDVRAERAQVAAVFREWRPDVMHSHGYRTDVLHGPVARAHGVPTVATVHGWASDTVKMKLYEWAQRRALRSFDRTIAVSAPIASKLVRSGVPADRIVLLRNAYAPRTAPLPRVAARARLGVHDDRLLVGWVGRVSIEKGPDLLVDAMARLGGPAEAVVIGDGPMRSSCEGAARERGARVRFVGSIPEAATVLPAFDLLALTSRTEGTPMVLLEAMAAGVPIVATSVGGVPDVLSAREGWLAEPEGERIAQALRDALERPSQRRDRAARAAERLRGEFAVGPWLDRHEALYGALRFRDAGVAAPPRPPALVHGD